MTQLYLDGHLVDVPPGSLRQTLQNNRLGEVKDRQLNFSPAFTLYMTARNEQFFGYMGELNSTTDRPYRYMSAKVVEDGLEIITGTAKVRKSNTERAQVYIYSGINSLYEMMAGKSLRDLDWSAYDHTLTAALAENSFANTDGYVYALSQQSNIFKSVAQLENWLPSVYEHTIFDMILTEAGFTYSGDLFGSAEFRAPVINPVTFDDEQPDLLVREFAKFMPDISQTDFLREILFRYGVMFARVRNTDEYEFAKLKDILRGTHGSVDWSAAFVRETDREYELGNYGTRNYFRYRNFDGYSGNADGFFDIDVDNLPDTKTLATSTYEARQNDNRFNYLQFPIFEYDDDDELTISAVPPSIGTIELAAITSLPIRNGDAIVSTFTGQAPYLRFTGLDFQGFIADNYFEFKQVANRAKVSTCEVYLDPVDIYNVDFFKLYYVRQMASYFYLNKISNWVDGSSCTAELVRIPPNVFSGAQATNTAPTAELFVSDADIWENTEVTFTHNVADAENNLEKWVLFFGNGAQVSGFGLPPATIPYTYALAGDFTATLTVTDFEGLSASDTVAVTVRRNVQTTFARNTGRYTALFGSVVNVNMDLLGTGTGQTVVQVGTVDTSSGNPGFNDLGERTVNNDLTFGPVRLSNSFSFVMPANGTVWLKAEHTFDPTDPTDPGQEFTSIEIENNGEVLGTTVSRPDPIIPLP